MNLATYLEQQQELSKGLDILIQEQKEKYHSNLKALQILKRKNAKYESVISKLEKN